MMDTATELETRRTIIREAVVELGPGRDAGIAKLAELLHVAPTTVEAWMKPPTSASANPVPMWAVDLWSFKRPGARAAQKRPRRRGAVVGAVSA